jgi:hypothetical protein
LVTAMSYSGVTASVDVAALFDRSGSVVPTGAATVAELLKVPCTRFDCKVPDTMKVAVVPGSSETVVLISPTPAAAAQVEPGSLVTHVHDGFNTVAGRSSATDALMADDGPVLVTMTSHVTPPPGTAVPLMSFLLTDSSATGVTVSASVAELFDESVSVNPIGATTAAVFTNDDIPAGVEGSTSAVSWKTAVVPAGNVTVELIEPEPVAVPQAAPTPETMHVHVALVSALGKLSVTTAFVAWLGPAFATVIVYVVVVPGTSIPEEFDFVTDRSPVGVTSSVSEAELFPSFVSRNPLGAVIVAVLLSAPTPAAVAWFKVPVAVRVTTPPLGIVTGKEIALPDPPVAEHVAPSVATHVQVTPSRDNGTESASNAFVAVEGPAFVATMVYVVA